MTLALGRPRFHVDGRHHLDGTQRNILIAIALALAVLAQFKKGSSVTDHIVFVGACIPLSAGADREVR